MNRRMFVEGAICTALAAGAGAARALASRGGAGKYHVRLGGPSFARTDDPEELALAHVRMGYQAAYCPPLSLSDQPKINAASAAFRKHGVVIAEVGRWMNLLDARPEIRKSNLDKVTEGLALAEAVGALCCVDIAGSYNPERWEGPHPDNLSDRFLDAAVENARKIIDAVRPKRAKFCYEMMPWALPDSPDSAVKMVKAVDRAAFAVHLDPCNLVNSPLRFYDNTRLLNECFDKLGKWIVSCHAKDIAWGPGSQVYIREVRPGTGLLDYKTYLARLAQLPQQPPLMLEHLPNAGEYDQARQYILGLLQG